jgi:ABC-2 type transport system ATP-binding protein
MSSATHNQVTYSFMDQPLIELSSLSHRYGNVVALDGLNVSVPTGSIGLVGANGAGKSTLIKILLGILRPTSGSVKVLGHDIPRELTDMRARVGYMAEGTTLPLDQTAADFMVYAAELAGIPTKAAKQRASDVLTLVGLHEERFRALGDFSTGMKQRAMLAQAIVHDPDLVFLDEPTAGLDPEGRDEMLQLITRLATFDIDVLVSSHVLSDIERTCDWVVMLDGGKLLRNGPIDRFVSSNTLELEVLGDATAVAESLRARGADVDAQSTSLLVTSTNDREVDVLIRDALADTHTGMRRLIAKRASLEDLFLEGDEA